jgi:hypothetical protein
MCLTLISYLLFGKMRILKTEDEVANASTILFFSLGIEDRSYSQNPLRRSKVKFLYALSLGCKFLYALSLGCLV